MTTGAQRVRELLVDRATEGLTPQLERELDQLLTRFPEHDPESFELAAAAIELAYTATEEPLPAALHERLTQQARDLQNLERPVPEIDLAEVATLARPLAKTPHGLTRWGGWLAAAASLLLAVAGWWPKGEEQRPDLVAARSELVAGTAGLLEVKWTATDDPASSGASGDVVWSTALQRGYMRFRGLPANDPAVEQYQLWIFDAEQDERYPVDGGVFDIPSTGEVVVEIIAKLEIIRPTLFAVTLEKPGGVVVSSRERLPLLGHLG